MAESNGFFAELRRRKVFRVAAVYAVVGWALIEFADVAFPRLALPDWTATFVLLLVLLGFPVAVILAWALEVTPEGIRRTPERPRSSDGKGESSLPERAHGGSPARRLTIRALGTLDIRDGEGVLDSVLSQPKRAALLTYLAMARPRGFHRRDTLLAMFWPDLDDTHARNALSQALSFLRREVAESVVVTRGSEEVGVAAERMGCDVVAFEQAVAGQRWAEALDLYRGDLLAGFHLTDAGDFDRWVEGERVRLRKLAAETAWSMAQERLAAGQRMDAERVARRALALAPTDETPVREFIEALARAGERAAALQFYQQFAAALEEALELDPSPETMAVAEAVRNGEIEALSRSGAEPAAREGVEPSFGPAPAGSRPLRRSSWRRAAWPAAGAVVLGLGGVVAAEWLAGRTGGPGTLIGEGLAQKYDAIVVADLASPFDPEIGKTAAEWLKAEIDQSSIIRPVGSVALSAALRRMGRDLTSPVDAETAREIAVRDGHPLVVTGEVGQVSGQYIFTVRLEGQEGDVFGRFNGAAGTDDFVDELDRIGAEIREGIGESRRSIRRSPPLAQVTTASLEALRLYTMAQRVRDWEGRHRAAIPLLERAIELDTAFASAYRKLRITLNNIGIQPGRQQEAIEKAYEHRDRLTDYERLMVDGAWTFANRQPGLDECGIYQPIVELYETYIGQHPEDPRPLHNLGAYLETVGRRSEAITIYHRILDLGRRSDITYGNLVDAYLRLGDLDSAGEVLASWREAIPESPQMLTYSSLTAYAKGEVELADSLLSVWVDRFGPDPTTLWRQGRIDGVRGRMRAAATHYQRVRHESRQRGELGTLAVMDLSIALTQLVTLRDTAAAVRDATAIVDSFAPGEAGWMVWYLAGVVYAWVGDVERAQFASDSVAARGMQNLSETAMLPAAIQTAAGNPDRSLEILDAADTGCSFPGGDTRPRQLQRGRAHEAAGRADSAVAAYESVMDDYPALVNEPMIRFDTLERLGRLHEELGHRDEAARYYARAAELWKDADPELQPRVQWLRERAAALTGER